MIKVPAVELNTGQTIPTIGFGTWNLQEGQEAKSAVENALKAGYRLIDTASIYGNEQSVGEAITKNKLPRENLFVTTKLWSDDFGFKNTFKACEKSLTKLGLDYVDLYLIHWPTEDTTARMESWRAMVKLQKDGKAKNIGVSNFDVRQLQEIIKDAGVVPAVNQNPFNPFVYKREKGTLEFCKKEGIVFEAYSPLSRMIQADNEAINAIAKKNKKNFAQVMLRWAIQHGTIPIPKSANLKRMKENLNVFDFELSKEDMNKLNGLS